MAEVPDTVDDAIDALGGTPTTEQVHFATLPFNPHDIASAAVVRALAGGDGGGSLATVTDGVHTVTSATELSFTGATVTDSGAGVATVAISSGASIAPFGQAGTLATGTGVAPFIFPFAATILGAVAAVNTAPTGASVKVDVNLNGTTIFTTQSNRPTIAAGAKKVTSMPTPDVTAASQFDVLNFDIDQIGSTIEGADLVVVVAFHA